MNYINHLIVGFCLCLIIAYFLFPEYIKNINQLIIFLIIGTVSALIPDLDHPKSKGTNLLNGAIFILLILFSFNLFLKDFSLSSIISFVFFSAVFCFAWLGLSAFIRPKHRGITHTFFAIGVYAVILYFVFDFIFLLAGLVGYFSHLLADRCFKLI
ncbi:MAG: metal-dependent hydrolase [Candidatus Micrarchaeia archaeon]|jgi:membrane-bound metal-dependent hydrolase YbcI (DUF457 family)